MTTLALISPFPHIVLLLFFPSQPDHNTAQYVLRMMINQHEFYRSELEGTPGISWLSGAEG